MIRAAYIMVDCFKGLRSGDIDRLTHINLSFALLKDGRATIEHWGSREIIEELIRNKERLKISLAVGGWGAGGFSIATATAKGRETLADSIVEIVEILELDGVDMDWEYPCDGIAGIDASPKDKPNYTAFIKLLRDKLGNERVLSMAAGGMQSCADNLEIPELVKYMNFINLMTYDMCPWDFVSYHPSLYPSKITKNLSGDEIVKIYEKAGASRSKLVLGAAFYGRLYQDVDGLNAHSGIPKFTDSYDHSLELAKAAGGVQYDEQAETCYAYDQAKRTFLTFENPRSLKAKVDYVRANGLAGIMYWQYCHDSKDSILLKSLQDE